jgi:hypothetical protein
LVPLGENPVLSVPLLSRTMFSTYLYVPNHCSLVLKDNVLNLLVCSQPLFPCSQGQCSQLTCLFPTSVPHESQFGLLIRYILAQ